MRKGLLIQYSWPDGFAADFEFTLDTTKLGALARRARKSKNHTSTTAGGALKCKLVRQLSPTAKEAANAH